MLDHTQLLLIYSNVSNFSQNLNECFGGLKFDEGCWNYHMIPVSSRAVSILPSGVKKNGKIVRLFCRFCHYFALVGKIDSTSLTRECSCILCPNDEKFFLNNGQFFSFGDATASPASPCRTLMVATTTARRESRETPFLCAVSYTYVHLISVQMHVASATTSI